MTNEQFVLLQEAVFAAGGSWISGKKEVDRFPPSNGLLITHEYKMCYCMAGTYAESDNTEIKLVPRTTYDMVAVETAKEKAARLAKEEIDKNVGILLADLGLPEGASVFDVVVATKVQMDKEKAELKAVITNAARMQSHFFK